MGTGVLLSRGQNSGQASICSQMAAESLLLTALALDTEGAAGNGGGARGVMKTVDKTVVGQWCVFVVSKDGMVCVCVVSKDSMLSVCVCVVSEDGMVCVCVCVV